MRVTITRGVRTKTAGFLNKKSADFALIMAEVQLSQEEQEVIKRWELGEYVVIDRSANADEKDISGGEPGFYAVRVRHLASGNPISTVFSIVNDAIVFEENLKAALKNTKDHLMACAAFSSSTETYEL
jgi:hypothetical protein